MADVGTGRLAVKQQLGHDLAGTKTVVDAPHGVAGGKVDAGLGVATDDRSRGARREREIALH